MLLVTGQSSFSCVQFEKDKAFKTGSQAIVCPIIQIQSPWTSLELLQIYMLTNEVISTEFKR